MEKKKSLQGRETIEFKTSQESVTNGNEKQSKRAETEEEITKDWGINLE